MNAWLRYTVLSLTLIIVTQFIITCKKVGFREDFGMISTSTSYWFEREETVYVFFAVDEVPERISNSFWKIEYVLDSTKTAGKTRFSDTIDFNKGIHKHRLVNCDRGRVCGSYSFSSKVPLDSLTISFHYDPASKLMIEASSAHRNITKSDLASSYSALFYGVFDETNRLMQPRVFNNFGLPKDAEIAAYGLERNFSVAQVSLANPSDDDLKSTAELVADPTLFPASFCTPSGSETISDFSSPSSKWLGQEFSRQDASRGACFVAALQDRDRKPIISDLKAFARRNPELSQPPLSLNTPLAAATIIPILLKYCANTPASEQSIDKDFLTYQQFILRMENRPEDLCFSVGKENDFRTQFTGHLASRLAAAKQDGAANGRNNDFIFNVLFHENFSVEFRKFHQIIAEELYRVIQDESDNISPRLSGAFVYAGSSDFKPTLKQAQSIIWCPQEINKNLDPTTLGSQNCTTSRQRELDLSIINFRAPLGPLPSLKNYHEYINDFGDKGLARKPRLFFDSVQHTLETRVERNKPITFLENQQMILEDGEYQHVCFDNPQAFDVLPRLYFRHPVLTSGDSPSVDISAASAAWLSDEAEGTYRIGMAWDHPFRGGISYKAVLSGQIVSIAPFTQSFSTFENLGSKLWSQERWELGPFFQTCKRFCNHPYFDENGTYQISANWLDKETGGCVKPRYPEVTND